MKGFWQRAKGQCWSAILWIQYVLDQTESIQAERDYVDDDNDDIVWPSDSHSLPYI
jgi:hypothetical protein